MKTQTKPKFWLFHACLATPFIALCAWSCSLQDFSYLENGGGAAGKAATAGGSGTSGVSGASGTGNAGSSSTAGKGGGSGSSGSGGSGGEAGNNGGGAPGSTLVNPSFEDASMNGWNIDPASAVTARDIYVQYPVSGSTAKDGSYVLSTWNGTTAFIVTASQTLSGLVDGKYTFQGYFSRGTAGNNDVHIFARNCGGVDPANAAVPATDSVAWVPVAIQGIDVIGGSCEVGIYIDSAANAWVNMDSFTFTKTPG